jgi:transcriptional regulator MraZ
MFKGRSFHTMDNKGRVSIPVRYRETLQENQDSQLVLTNWEGYILAFPQAEWVRVEHDLLKLDRFTKANRDFLRHIVSGAEECPLDKQGRILIPQILREYAKLERDVVVVGMVSNFEIWDKQRFEAYRQRAEENMDEGVLNRVLSQPVI